MWSKALCGPGSHSGFQGQTMCRCVGKVTGQIIQKYLNIWIWKQKLSSPDYCAGSKQLV